MAHQTAAKPDRLTGLPSGVAVGPLGRRFVAHLIDLVVPTVLAVIALATPGDGASPQTGDVVAFVLIGVWDLAVWWMFATRAAGPGMRLMKLQLVGFRDGRPVGWARFLLRALLLGLLGVTGIGLLLMLVFLVRQPRYQGWHDLAADSVVIRERMLAPRTARPATADVTADPAGGAATPTDGVAEPRVAPALAAPPPAPRGSEVEPVPVPVLQRPAEDDETGLLAPPGWMAVLDDGLEVPVQGLVLLGRNPQPQPGEERAELVKLADDTRTVSKSHLALDVDAGGLVVTDRGSTNGSTVTTVDGVTVACRPDKPVAAPEGSVVSMGDHWLTVRRD